jgi:hypothetical protein
MVKTLALAGETVVRDLLRVGRVELAVAGCAEVR